MLFIIITFLSVLCEHVMQCNATLWAHGKVHFSINGEDYDMHSQDVITKTMSELEKELCIKFFQVPYDYRDTHNGRILYITNPLKLKDCPTHNYNYNNNIMEMAIGYGCLDEKNVAKSIMEMLKQSIPEDEQVETNNGDLAKLFGQASPGAPRSLIPASERYLINAKYEAECRLFVQPTNARRDLEIDPNLGRINMKHYANRIWPLGVVIYDVEPELLSTNSYQMLKYAINEIQRGSCVAFQELFDTDGVIEAKNLVSFGTKGAADPPLGFKTKVEVNLLNFTRGDPGHTSNVLNNLMRILGVPMMSNRYDRDSYVKINWVKIPHDKRMFFELESMASFINTSYCFESVTHAPINYKCSGCNHGEQTVTPLQEVLWHKSLKMGKVPVLSAVDRDILDLMYSSECYKREEMQRLI